MTGRTEKFGCCCSSVLFIQTYGWPRSHREGFYLSYRTVISCLQSGAGIPSTGLYLFEGKAVSASQRHGRAEIVSHCEYIILLNVLDMNEKDCPGVKETVLHDYKLLFSVYTQPHSIFCLSHSASSFLGGRRWRHL